MFPNRDSHYCMDLIIIPIGEKLLTYQWKMDIDR